MNETALWIMILMLKLQITSMEQYQLKTFVI